MSVNSNLGNKQQASSSTFSHGAQGSDQTFSSGVGGGSNNGDNGRWSFSDLGAGEMPMPFGSGSEVLNQLKESMEEQLEAKNLYFDTKVIAIDAKERNDLGISVLVVCTNRKNVDKKIVATSILIVSDSLDEKLGSRTIPIPAQNGLPAQQIEQVLVPGDTYDEQMHKVVVSEVAKHYPGWDIIPADAMVVPPGFDSKDKGAVRKILKAACAAVGTEVSAALGFSRSYSLSKVEREGLNVKISFGGDDKYTNDAGTHIRADFATTMQTSPPQQGQNNQNISLNSKNNGTVISTAVGFVDLVYARTVAENGFMGMGMMQPGMDMAAMLRSWAPQAIITDVKSPKLQNITGLMLSLLPILGLAENYAWVSAFKSRNFNSKPSDIDLNDIGNLGYEAKDPQTGQPPGYLGTKSANFTDADLMRFISMYLHPTLNIAMDVPECAPETYFMRPILEASRGVPGARAQVIGSLDELTDGHFSKIFDGGDISYNDHQRIHLGEFDSNTGPMDSRAMGYLGVLALTAKNGDMQTIKDWSESFITNKYPQVMALNGRRKIIEALLPSVKFHGYAWRFTFRKHFLEAFAAAVKACGLDIKINNPYNDLNGHERASASFMAEGMSNTGGMFNRGGFGGGFTGVTGGFGGYNGSRF